MTPRSSRNPSFATSHRDGRRGGESAVGVVFLSEAERQRLDRFPTQVVPGDLATYFTLSRADRAQIPRTTSAANRLGFALKLGALRYLALTQHSCHHGQTEGPPYSGLLP